MDKSLFNLSDILTQTDKNIEKEIKENIKKENQKDYVYVKDSEGFVSKILKSNLTDEYTIITKNEWAEQSGEKYYKETFGHGGKRKGAGRKPKTGILLEFQVRLSAKEKEFINYARNHHLDYDELMQG